MAVIADFEAYPEWATGMTSARIESTSSDSGRPLDVHFEVSSAPISDEFTLRYTWGSDQVSWYLVSEATMLSTMDGTYIVQAISATQAKVIYQLEVDVKLPLLGLLKRKAEKVIIDTALKGLKRRVEAPDDRV